MRALSLTIALVLLTAVLVAPVFIYPVDADSEPIIFPDSGVIIYSPVNMTYNGNNLILYLTLDSAGSMGQLDPQISMNYSIDGSYNGSVPLKSNGEVSVATIAIANFTLPKIIDGSHELTIYLYGLNQRTYEPKYLSYTNTVYFSTTGNPSGNITPTFSPTVKPSSSQISSSSPSPTVPELSWLVVLPLLLSIFFVTIVFRQRKG